MKHFDLGALRRAMKGLGGGAASDLVRRTLARHGLDGAGMPAGMPAGSPAGMPGGATGGKPRPFARPAPAAPAIPPGARFDADHFSCAAGSRDMMVYVPSSAAQGVQGMVLMLHGCTQNPADFALGTGMNDLAETHRLILVYPRQSRGDNAQSCWNWFSPGDQRRGRGEPEILAQMASQLAVSHGVPEGRIFVAGLSAGAAMAVILGQTHPEIFAAVGAHSGLPFAAARDVPGAFAAMAGSVAPASATVMTPTIVFHGSADKTVHPVNGDRIAADSLATGPAQTLFDDRTGSTNGRAHRRETTTAGDGQTLLEYWVVDGLGHAWSGGRPGGSYTDPQGPDASAEMVRFFLGQPRRV